MSAQAASYKETVTFPNIVNFTVCHRQDSAFSKDGGKTRINTSLRKRILPEDRCVLKKEMVEYFNQAWGSEYLTYDDKGVVTTMNGVVLGSFGTEVYKRHIRGSNIIFKTEQVKLNVLPTKDDEIFMVWGEYSVDAKTRTTSKGLLVFLITHNQNEDYPYRDDTIANASFKVNDSKRNATLVIDERQDKIQEARGIVYELRNLNTKKFDKDKINFYTNVFRKQIGGYDSDEEKFTALLQIADTNPDMIINGIHKETVNFLQVVNEAIALDILTRGQGKYNNSQTGNSVITFKAGTSEELAIEKMVTFYSSKDGANEFEHLKNSVEAVKISRAT